jgi:citrate synthase
MSETTEPAQIHRGLKGVYFDRSRVCFIDGRQGELAYRGYSIHDLAERSSFEETCYLLLHGELPSRNELARFDGELKAARNLPAPLLDIIATVKDAHPMDVLRTAVSALAAYDAEAADNSAAEPDSGGGGRLQLGDEVVGHAGASDSARTSSVTPGGEFGQVQGGLTG